MAPASLDAALAATSSTTSLACDSETTQSQSLSLKQRKSERGASLKADKGNELESFSFFIFHEGNDLCHTRPPLPLVNLNLAKLELASCKSSSRKLAISFCTFAACQSIGSQNLPFPAGHLRKKSAIQIRSSPTAYSPTLAAFSQAIGCLAKN